MLAARLLAALSTLRLRSVMAAIVLLIESIHQPTAQAKLALWL
jgi:hypothetical protein